MEIAAILQAALVFIMIYTLNNFALGMSGLMSFPVRLNLRSCRAHGLVKAITSSRKERSTLYYKSQGRVEI